MIDTRRRNFTNATTLYTHSSRPMHQPPIGGRLFCARTSREDKMSHTAWTGMLTPDLLEILSEANTIAGLDAAKVH